MFNVFQNYLQLSLIMNPRPYKNSLCFAWWPLIVSLLIGLASLQAANSISQYGITWTFSESKTVGQYANGDWWVLGPVTITRITPAASFRGDGRPVNGSMLNPIPGQTQGLCNPGGSLNSPAYSASKNIALQLPITVTGGNSVYSTMDNPDTWTSGPAGEKTFFRETAVLTVVSAVPPAGSFRPPYAGNDKTLKANWNVNSMNFNALARLSPPIPANLPDRAWLENATKRPLLEMHYNWVNSQWKASWAENKPGGYPRRTYGREISHISSQAGLYLQTNVPDNTKRQLLINMCQWGIDVFGLLNAGMKWEPNGGHQHGRLLPLFIAAKVLGDSEMLAKCSPSASQFQEFSQHWFVTQTDIDTPRSPSTLQPFTAQHLGMPEWCSGGAPERHQATPDWNATGYRFINGAPNCAVVATVLLMNGRADVGHEPLFRYIIDRYYPSAKGGAMHTIPNYGDSPTLFTRDMWDAYVAGNPPPAGGGGSQITSPDSSFNIGDRVVTTRLTNVRTSGSLSADKIGEQTAGSAGTLLEGPVFVDNITWWRIDYDTGVDGWSGDDNLTAAPRSSLPSKVTGFRVVN